MKKWPEFDHTGDLPVGIHQAAQNVLGASIFWIRRLAAIGGEPEALQHWQIKRDNTRRGIVEVISDDSQ